ncbi:MAG: hypothetical protein ACKVOW_14290 [Chitinophagaceae bacterium]
MLTENEKQFVNYWEIQRVKEKKWGRQLLIGLPVGLIFAIPIMIIQLSGKLWFKRADTVANSKASPFVLIIAIILISVFVGIFYKRHQWDIKEQQYQELKARAEKEPPMQL